MYIEFSFRHDKELPTNFRATICTELTVLKFNDEWDSNKNEWTLSALVEIDKKYEPVWIFNYLLKAMSIQPATDTYVYQFNGLILDAVDFIDYTMWSEDYEEELNK